MKHFFLLVLAMSVAISCSKPSQEGSSSSDSTSVATEPQTPDGTSTERTAVTLTAEEADRVAIETFLWIRNRMLGNSLAYKEEFTINGDEFQYMLLRHNLDNAGMSSTSYSGTRSPTPDEEMDWEADSANTEPLQFVPYTEVKEYYVAEIDTFYVKGKYVAYLDSEPEATPRKMTIELVGTETHQNANYVQYGEPIFSAEENNIAEEEDGYSDPTFTVDFATDFNFKRDELYVKAKIKDLTDKDLAGLSKDELSFVRNDIFARHGHTFKTAKMVEHYKGADWYHAVINDAASLLNKFEKKNVEFIKKREG